MIYIYIHKENIHIFTSTIHVQYIIINIYMYNASRVKLPVSSTKNKLASKVKVIGVSLSNPLIFKQL